MAKYNQKTEKVVKKTINHEGYTGLTQSPVNELIGMLSTGMGGTFYEKESEREKRFKTILAKVAKKDKLFAAKALIYARTVFGQRSVTHLGAVEMLTHLQGDSLGKKFYSRRNKALKTGGIIYRIDDMTEILSAYLAKNKIKSDDKWTMPNSIKKGFKDAIENADKYELAKYQLKNRSVSLVDIINLVHPEETDKQGFVYLPKDKYLKLTSGTRFVGKEFETMSDGNVKIPTLRALVLGILKQFNTVEDKNTKSGQEVASKVKSGELSASEASIILNESKNENYKELIETKKIGYLALLRNLRNIIKINDLDLLKKATDLLTNEKFIKRSLVWPHQIDLALEIMLIEFGGNALKKVANALNTAYELSIPNLNQLLPPGNTAIVFDTSGSMQGGWNDVMIPYGKGYKNISDSPATKAALVAATFAKSVGCDVYHFANYTRQITGWNPADSINTLKNKFMSYNGKVGHGTAFGSCFDEFTSKRKLYDRIVIISDEQDNYGEVEQKYKNYANQFGMPHVYIINIAGYAATSTLKLKSNNKIHRLFGYTQDIYEKIPELEINTNAVIEAINKIQI